MDDELKPIFEEFERLLNERFAALDERETSEDDIRYMFYLACTGEKGNINRHDIMLEKKNVIRGSDRAELDTFIQKSDKTPWLAIEFKYHRKELDTAPKFDWAGNLVCDFHRLTRLAGEAADAQQLSVYVASKDMIAEYENRRTSGIRKEQKGKSDWAKQMCDLILNHPAAPNPFALPNASATFTEKTKVAGVAFTGCNIKCRYSATLEGTNANGKDYKNALRIFEIS